MWLSTHTHKKWAKYIKHKIISFRESLDDDMRLTFQPAKKEDYFYSLPERKRDMTAYMHADTETHSMFVLWWNIFHAKKKRNISHEITRQIPFCVFASISSYLNVWFFFQLNFFFLAFKFYFSFIAVVVFVFVPKVNSIKGVCLWAKKTFWDLILLTFQ